MCRKRVNAVKQAKTWSEKGNCRMLNRGAVKSQIKTKSYSSYYLTPEWKVLTFAVGY